MCSFIDTMGVFPQNKPLHANSFVRVSRAEMRKFLIKRSWNLFLLSHDPSLEGTRFLRWTKHTVKRKNYWPNSTSYTQTHPFCVSPYVERLRTDLTGLMHIYGRMQSTI